MNFTKQVLQQDVSTLNLDACLAVFSNDVKIEEYYNTETKKMLNPPSPAVSMDSRDGSRKLMLASNSAFNNMHSTRRR